MRTKILALFVVIVIVAFACNNVSNKDKSVEDEHITMSDEDLFTEETALGEMPEYTKIPSGESERIERSFENAPPLIPHKIGGFLPISAGDNKCLWCHMPEKAKNVEATPLPQTHFTSYRPQILEEDGIFVVQAAPNEVVERDLNHFNNAMYNCSQCHVSQANVSLSVENLFKADYRASGNRSHSNLKDKMDEGVR